MKGTKSSVKDKSKSFPDELKGQAVKIQDSKQDVEKSSLKGSQSNRHAQINLIGRKDEIFKNKNFLNKSHHKTHKRIFKISHKIIFQINHQKFFRKLYLCMFKPKIKLGVDRCRSLDIIKGFKIMLKNVFKDFLNKITKFFLFFYKNHDLDIKIDIKLVFNRNHVNLFQN